MANSHPNVIPFPVRPGNPPQISNPNAQLLRAAKAAERALTLALGVEAAENNVIVRKLRSAIASVERTPEPPTTPSHGTCGESAVKLTQAAAATILRDKRSTTCFCGMGKQGGRPFCLRCYHSLPERMRASLYLNPLDSDQIFDAILEARAYLVRLGMLSARESIA